ncbi:hypothetical protein ACP275_14G174600 [Erythranthe tilingii]
MAGEDDFTFCPVPPPVDDTQKVADDVSGIRIDDVNENASDKISNKKNGSNMFKISGTSQKQETVGSLSFTVTDASSSGRIDQQPRKTTEVGPASSAKASPPVKRSTARAKVPFEKGYSQVDWLKLTRTHPDLAGLKGQSNKRLISLNEVKQNQSEDSMWTVLKGRVYNIAPYMKFHPGGVDMLMKAVGKDCTSLFNKYHAWVNAEFMLEKCLVGVLDVGK